jgi:hypothetical protein
MHYLQTVYQSPKIPSPYKKLAKNNLWIWFTPKKKNSDQITYKQHNKVRLLNT